MLSNQVGPTVPALFQEAFVPQGGMIMRTDKQENQTLVSRNGDKRLGIERRRFSYDAHMPERRSGQDRRSAGLTPEIPFESSDEIALALA
jgi:hypothetical protein